MDKAPSPLHFLQTPIHLNPIMPLPPFSASQRLYVFTTPTPIPYYPTKERGFCFFFPFSNNNQQIDYSVAVVHAGYVYVAMYNLPNSDMGYRIFNVRTDVNACDCTQGCMDTERQSALKIYSRKKKKKKLPHWGIEPLSAA